MGKFIDEVCKVEVTPVGGVLPSCQEFVGDAVEYDSEGLIDFAVVRESVEAGRRAGARIASIVRNDWTHGGATGELNDSVDGWELYGSLAREWGRAE